MLYGQLCTMKMIGQHMLATASLLTEWFCITFQMVKELKADSDANKRCVIQGKNNVSLSHPLDRLFIRNRFYKALSK